MVFKRILHSRVFRPRQCLVEAPGPPCSERGLGFRFERADAAALGLIAVLTLLLWFSRGLVVPVPPDGYYHLTVAQKLLERGAVPLWADWEFAPFGRPHLYPPGLHLLIAGAARMLGGDALDGFRAVQALILPAALFCTWYAARWLFGAGRGLAALLVLGWDVAFMYSGLLCLPAALATGLCMLLPVLLLNRRWYIAALVGAAAFYLHLGVPALFCLGLLMFGLLRRCYLSDVLACFAVTAALIAPWYLHVWAFADWFSHPVDAGVWGEFGPWQRALLKLLWLQNLNLLLPLLVWRGLRMVNRRDDRTVVLLCLALGLLPLLVSYGGRYYLHSLPLWAIVAGAVLVPWVRRPAGWRRLAGAVGIALVAPYIAFFSAFYPQRPPMVLPMPSGWLVPPALRAAGWEFLREGKRLGFPWEDIVAMGAYIRENSEPDQIIHVRAPLRFEQQIAGALAWAAERPIDTALWEEAAPPAEIQALLEQHNADDPSGIYVRFRGAFRRGTEGTLPGMEWRRFGRFEAAVRKPPI